MLGKNRAPGGTITTDIERGTIVIALMAVLATVGARADGAPADGLFRQQQAILRTIPTPTSLTADYVKLWWLWKKRTDRVSVRSLFPILLATFCTMGFLASSVASSFVVATTDLEVLVDNPFCARYNESTFTTDIERLRIIAVRSVSVPYAQECYHNQTLLPPRCKAFVRPSIPFTTQKVPCPFSLEYYTGAETDPLPAVAFDSGLVDLNDGFGMNLPNNDRVSYRRRTTCTVLPLSGHITVLDAGVISERIWGRTTFPGEQAVKLHYADRPALGEWKNATFLVSLTATNISEGFSITSRFYSPEREREGIFNTLEPLEGMRRKDADLTLIALTGAVTYTKPVYDPWFLALTTMTLYDVIKQTNKQINSTVYIPDSPVRAMGCIVQHQFCIKTDSSLHCSALDSLPRGIPSKGWERASSVQLSALELLIVSNKEIGLGYTYNAVQVHPDQWIIEARAMESFVWASLQVSIADYAIGPSVRSSDLADYIVKPTTAGDKQLCGSQKMRIAGGFVNINVFGMAFVITVSLFFAIVDIVLLKFLGTWSSLEKDV
ncbi:hypothetical protein CC80DRAFT_518396 [Byssothecium circinans]|uniref:Uncharacterized protein n=1 Tax=Byssothecium circinans TaxID=147558 RepID=A0A6A5TR43_9PLEO|nr:hypothetical protein CC80DRAFT_518396 [Byssothecium circinans]